MGMTNEEREKHIRIANMLIGAINDLIRPILLYQIEKDVTREALENYIKMLEQHPCEDVEEYGMNEQMESSSEKPNKSENPTSWIPVTERLPEDGQDVLICDIDGDIMIGYHVRGRLDTHFSQQGSYEHIKNVKAWMPLPEPYKTESEDKE